MEDSAFKEQANLVQIILEGAGAVVALLMILEIEA